MLRTHTCGELNKKFVNKEVTLAGWVNKIRTHGKLTFLDIRDRYGITQLILDSSQNKGAYELASKLKREWVIKATGKVKTRKDINKEIPTGEIEIIVDDLTVLNESDVLPVDFSKGINVTDDMRLKFRYLDLRRHEMVNNLQTRHRTMAAAFEYLDKNNFMYVETPMLVKSTPEGARDYVVPSRVNPGQFYALPQSPQLYKQILMVSGIDRYFQFARCLRDEDLRIDRQPEHTQIDLEMSFVELDDLYSMFEGLIAHIWNKVLSVNLKLPFPRISHFDSMNKYGSDKPDLRFGLEIVDVSDIVIHSDFSVFRSAVDSKGHVKCLNAKGCAEFSRKEIDKLTELAKTHHAKGLVTLKVKGKKLEGSVAKYFNDIVQEQLIKATYAQEGDLLLFVADKWETACKALGQLRLYLGEKLNLIGDDWKFCWITNFPLFEWNEDEKRFEPAHHMFCMPKAEHVKLLEEDPAKVICTQYDLALNGVELGSGSIRINRPDVQEKVMKVIGLNKKDLERKFGFLLESFKYGAPPHGGIGLGFDRIVALICGTNDIREVIAFPKNKNAQCPMDGSPNTIDEVQMRELSIKLNLKQ